jgi:hypothetical protein
MMAQVEDWKKGHNKACKTLFIDRVDRAYDVGHVGLTHDGTRVRALISPFSLSLPSLLILILSSSSSSSC